MLRGGAKFFFCAQIKTRFACELTRCARANTRFAQVIFCSYFRNFMFLKILPPPWVKSCSRPWNNRLSIFIIFWERSSSTTGGGRKNTTHGFGKSQPGFWKIPPRLLENPTQGFGKLQSLLEPCDYTFLDKQVSGVKWKKWWLYVELNWTIFMYVTIYLLTWLEVSWKVQYSYFPYRKFLMSVPPGFWKTPPRVLENPTQVSWKITKFPRTMRL